MSVGLMQNGEKKSLVGLLHTKEGLRAKSCHARDLKMNPELSTIPRAVSKAMQQMP